MEQTSSTDLPLDFFFNDKELRLRHEMNKDIKLGYLYFPTQTDIVDFDPKKLKKTLRRIFQSKVTDYLDHEIQFLKELHQEIEKYNQNNPKKKLIFPSWFKESDKLRLNQATSYNYSKTIKLILESIEWREANIPPRLTNKVLEILNCGFVYVHGRDCKFRPIIVINVEYYKKNEDLYTYDEWLQATIYFMEYIVNNLLIPGQVENWDVISDFGSTSFFFLPSNVKKLMGILQSNWRCRLYINYVLNMSSIIRGIWKVVKAFLDEATVQKVQFLEGSTKKNIFTYINEEQVEQKFGGKAPNVVPGMNRLFPPVFPSDNFLKPDQDEADSCLISEEKYKELHESNKLPVVGKYFLNKWQKEEEEQKIIIEKKMREEEEANIKLIEEKSKNVSLSGNVRMDLYQEELEAFTRMDLKLEKESSIPSKDKFHAIKGNIFKNPNPKVMKYFNNKIDHLPSPPIESTPEIIRSQTISESISKFSSISLKENEKNSNYETTELTFKEHSLNLIQGTLNEEKNSVNKSITKEIITESEDHKF
jgi:hypothetical protein